MGCSFILHFSFCSVFMEFGINVGGSVKATGVKNSGLVMCWHVALCISLSMLGGLSVGPLQGGCIWFA